MGESTTLNNFLVGENSPISAYLSANTELNAAKTNAITQFANELITAGVWDRILWCYPHIGSTVANLRLDLKGGTVDQMPSLPASMVGGTFVNCIHGNGTGVFFSYASKLNQVDLTDFTFMISHVNVPGNNNNYFMHIYSNPQAGSIISMQKNSTAWRYRVASASYVTATGSQNTGISAIRTQGAWAYSYFNNNYIRGASIGSIVIDTNAMGGKMRESTGRYNLEIFFSPRITVDEMTAVYNAINTLDIALGR